MTKPEITKRIRLWVRGVLPYLRGVYSYDQLYTGMRRLFNDNVMWDTIHTSESIGTYMVRMEVLRAVREGKPVTRIEPGVYCFN